MRARTRTNTCHHVNFNAIVVMLFEFNVTLRSNCVRNIGHCNPLAQHECHIFSSGFEGPISAKLDFLPFLAARAHVATYSDCCQILSTTDFY